MSSILNQIQFRQVIPADIPACFEIEKASYPDNEGASKKALQYRQHFAEKYFRCAVLDEEQVVGFICATRCRQFTAEAMTSHDATGPLLAIHSVVVKEEYRHQGIATTMMQDYWETMANMPDGVERLVLLAKPTYLSFYVKCGFSVLRPSEIEHGDELWFHLERQKEVGRSCWVADAFTETPGGGNPAAIVMLDSYSEESDADWCRTVAKEFNLAETAFIWRLQGSDSYYGIRYYTMNGTEITLCGHATLAASVVIFQQYPSLEQITFSAKADELIITPTKYYSGKRMQVTMNFPRKTLKALDDQSHVIDMLERAIPALKDRVKDSVLYTGLDEDGNDLLIEVEPDFFHAIDNVIYNCLDWSGYQRGVIICCLASTEEPTDFLSRFFAPKAGILEDPVTGSAHCTLAPYFGAKLEKTDLQAEQCSTRRGKIQCSLLEGKRVALTGSAIITVSGSSWI